MKRLEDAAVWAVRRAAGPLSPDDRGRFDAWLAADRHRPGQLLRAEVALSLIDRAQAVMPGEVPNAGPTRRRAIGWSAAALAAGAAGLALLPSGERLRSGLGEIRTVRLADASMVMLNTRSAVRVDFAPDERRIRLDEGEAWFKVAHNRHRPFVVSVAGLRVRAVGTAFSVRRLATGVDVLVTEGTVEVWRADQPRQRAAVTRDHRVFVPDDSVAIAPVADAGTIDRSLAWRSRRLALAGEALDYAIAEINRYNLVQIRVDDPALGRTPVYGYFRIDDPAGFAKLIAAGTRARVEQDGGSLRLIPKVS